MSILPGHEDLKSRAILGFDSMGFALVQHGEDVSRYKLFVGPGGKLHAEPLVEGAAKMPDQLQPDSVRMRLRNYDQT